MENPGPRDHKISARECLQAATFAKNRHGSADGGGDFVAGAEPSRRNIVAARSSGEHVSRAGAIPRSSVDPRTAPFGNPPPANSAAIDRCPMIAAGVTVDPRRSAELAGANDHSLIQ